ncbi:MAG: LPXTG cell wall anchor domain-containing protein [Oscillospiraceae bacterium]|nr:LPXTG cell wall anchor domain-containing protein [Oscillospiraceae bacterium]
MKKIFSIASVLLLIAVLVTPVAADHVDMERTGSITAAMTHEGKPVPGGTLTLYRVADMHPFGDELFTLTDAYAPSEVTLDVLGPETAVDLAVYTYNHQLSGLTKPIGDDGVVKFENLEVGLYLLIQWESAPGFYELSPFLMSLPNNEGGVYVYDIDSAPKQNPDPYPDKPTDPTEPTEPPTKPPEPSVPPSPNLPQTGQTNWPVPVLAVCGCLLVVLGVVVLIRERKCHER